jgi:hypothetical protein
MQYEHHVLKVPTRIGMRSLVGIDTSSFPTSFGNYFSLACKPDGSPGDITNCLRIVNFWAENLNEATRRFLTDGMVRVHVWMWISMHPTSKTLMGHAVGIIDDERVPDSWYHRDMCWTGHGRPPLEIAREMYAAQGGDLSGQLEQWTDPASYYAKRGGTYNPLTGAVTYQVKADSRKLNSMWMSELPPLSMVMNTTDNSKELSDAITKEIEKEEQRDTKNWSRLREIEGPIIKVPGAVAIVKKEDNEERTDSPTKPAGLP